MRSIITTHLFVVVMIFLNVTSNAQNASFTDHGFIPNLSISVGAGNASEFQTAIYYDGEVFIATNDGIWKNNISTQMWNTSGLQGIRITCLYQNPNKIGKFYAGAYIDPLGVGNVIPLFISEDGGISWIPVTSLITDVINCFAGSPTNSNHIYANVSGNDIIVSIDSGYNWTAPIGAFGDESNIIFTPGDDSTIYQGSESPLDCAWLGKYQIDNMNPSILSNFSIVVDGLCGTGPWENRRPNKLQTYNYTGNYIYVGQEGALSKVDPSGLNLSTYIYKSQGEPNKPYSYIYALWVDSVNTNHIIFGGSINGYNTGLMQLYETWDEGSTFHRYTQTFSINAPQVFDIVDIGNNKIAIVINDQNNDRVKLLIMTTQLLSVPQNSLVRNEISIFPTPTNHLLRFQYSNHEFNNILLRVYNNEGKLVLEIQDNKPIPSIDLHSLKSGVYQLLVTIDKQQIFKKILLIK